MKNKRLPIRIRSLKTRHWLKELATIYSIFYLCFQLEFRPTPPPRIFPNKTLLKIFLLVF